VSPIAENAEQILNGTARPHSAIAVVGAGTGLGKAALIPDQSGRLVGMPSEGGHTTFAPESAREFEFQAQLTKKLGKEYLVWDDVVSGRGLSHIHAFLTGETLTPAEVAQGFNASSETLEWAARLYGRVSRNFVLETLAMGGLYIAGGVAAKNPVLISHEAFERSFRSSAAHAALLEAVPVFLIDNEESGLWGAAYYGLQEIGVLFQV
jgi:glucokinase